MIARSWQGVIPKSKTEAYHKYVRRTGVRDLRKTPGNRGVFILLRSEGDRTHIIVMSLWESLDQIRAFAGDDISRAHYYPEDRDYLLELEPTVDHYEVATAEGIGGA